VSRAQRAALLVTVTDARGRPLAARGLALWLQRTAPRSARGVVSIALVSDRTMRRLNREFRGLDKPTDVLSFSWMLAGPHPRSRRSGVRRLTILATAAGAFAGPKPRASSPKPAFLGDLAIALGVARRQAREAGHLPYVEWRILALHGLLHLLGYDHETDRGQMRRVEERLRRRAGVPAGLVARATRSTRNP